MNAAPMGSEVYVLDVEVTGPEPGDYYGKQSVHATVQGAADKSHEFLGEAGLDFDDLADYIDPSKFRSTADSWATDIVMGDVKVSMGWHRMVVEP